ncbi:MAG: TetR/AcrR family transcriptional regulator [Desulfovibrionaceae bacterium]
MARRQQEKSQQTQEELMAAAVELFGSKGFFATTISEITARAGYAKGSFYRHWSGKDEIMLRIIERKLSSYRSARDERLAQAASLEEALGIIWDFLENIIADRNWSRVFLEFSLHASRDPQLREEMHKPGHRLSSAIFADLVRPFVKTDYPPEKIGAINTALFEGFLIHNILETGTISRDDVKKAAIALAVSKGEPGGASSGDAPGEPYKEFQE